MQYGPNIIEATEVKRMPLSAGKHTGFLLDNIVSSPGDILYRFVFVVMDDNKTPCLYVTAEANSRERARGAEHDDDALLIVQGVKGDVYAVDANGEIIDFYPDLRTAEAAAGWDKKHAPPALKISLSGRGRDEFGAAVMASPGKASPGKMPEGKPYFLRMFCGDRQENYGESEEWGDIDKFTSKAVKVAEDALKE